MARLQLLVALVLSALATVAYSAAPTFCKCTCFKNSTIIPLGPASQLKDSSSSPALLFPRNFPSLSDRTRASSQASAPATPKHDRERRSASTSCSECTKAFCLSQGIVFCKDAKEENVVTMCFQRDSNKDKFIVWGFILGTVGLLGWATFKRVVEWRDNRALNRQAFSYSSVADTR